MGKMRIEFNSAGFQALLSGPEVRADIERRTRAIADAAGENFEAQVKVGMAHGGMRVIGTVAPTSFKGVKEESEHKVLTSALGAGR